MNREADSAGLASWINVLSSGQSREHVFNGFADSPEFTRLYQDMLDGVSDGTEGVSGSGNTSGNSGTPNWNDQEIRKNYAGVLYAYQNAEKGNFSGDYDYVSKACVKSGGALYYTVVDMASDNGPELVIAQKDGDNTYRIVDIYTYVDGHILHPGYARGEGCTPILFENMWICENGFLKEITTNENGENVGVTYYEMHPDSAMCTLVIFGVADILDGQQFYATSDDGFSMSLVTKEEVESLYTKYPVAENLQWVKLSGASIDQNNVKPCESYKDQYLEILEKVDWSNCQERYFLLRDLDNDGIEELLYVEGPTGDSLHLHVYSYDPETEQVYRLIDRYAPLVYCMPAETDEGMIIGTRYAGYTYIEWMYKEGKTLRFTETLVAGTLEEPDSPIHDLYFYGNCLPHYTAPDELDRLWYFW